MRTTLNKIREHHPCHDGWQKLLRGLDKTKPDDDPLWIDQVLDHNGLDDAFWCLRAVENFDREIRLYAVWCAGRVRHLMTDPGSIAALDFAERHARGEASAEELASARTAAWAAARAWAAYAAAWAASWSARNAERAAQANELRRICREMREDGR
jgi:hypothetical protein